MEHNGWIVIFEFGEIGALFGLFHMAVLGFVRFRKVFINSGSCETRKSGRVAALYCGQ